MPTLLGAHARRACAARRSCPGVLALLGAHAPACLRNSVLMPLLAHARPCHAAARSCTGSRAHLALLAHPVRPPRRARLRRAGCADPNRNSFRNEFGQAGGIPVDSPQGTPSNSRQGAHRRQVTRGGHGSRVIADRSVVFGRCESDVWVKTRGAVAGGCLSRRRRAGGAASLCGAGPVGAAFSAARSSAAARHSQNLVRARHLWTWWGSSRHH